MINIEGFTLPEKAWIVAREIVRNKHNPLMVRLAKELGTPENAYRWVKEHIKYKRENGDILYEPDEILKSKTADCEDLSLLIGTIAKIQGYPVKLKIVKNGTRHIYPLVKIKNKWVVMDATPHRHIPYINGTPIGYKTVVEGIVDDNLSGFNVDLKKSIITGAGVAIGSTIAKIALSKIGLNGLMDFNKKVIEVGGDYIPKEGDHLLFYFKPKWYIPDAIEKWILKKVVKKKVPNCRIHSVYFKNINKIKYLVVDVIIVADKNLGALVVTILAIAGALLAGGLTAYFTLDKVEKIVEKPQIAWFMEILPIALAIYGIAKIVRG